MNEHVLAGSATFQAIREAAWKAVLSASVRPANAKAEEEDPAAVLGIELRKKRTNNFSQTALKKWAMMPPTLQVELNGWLFRVLTPSSQNACATMEATAFNLDRLHALLCAEIAQKPQRTPIGGSAKHRRR